MTTGSTTNIATTTTVTSETASASDVSNKVSVGSAELLFEDISQKINNLGKLSKWSETDQQILEAQVDVILWQQTASAISSTTASFAHRLWEVVLGTNSKLLKWEFVEALRRLESAEAIALEAYIVSQLLKSPSPGDRLAAIESLWHRDRYRARSKFRKLLKSETDKTVREALQHYSASGSHASAVSSAA